MSSLLNPISYFLPVLLIIISLPLTIFAGFTTLLAIGTLLFRASIVYVELGVALLNTFIFSPPCPPTKAPKPSRLSPTSSIGRSSPVHRRSRRSSIISIPSLDSVQETPYQHGNQTATLRSSRSESFASLIGDEAPDRDYEGVGGWREDSNAHDTAEWSRINSRLELPGLSSSTSNLRALDTSNASALVPGSGNGNGHRPRRHMRSLTSSSQFLVMSPVQMKSRTSSGAGREELGYFGQIHGSVRRLSIGAASALSLNKNITNDGQAVVA